MLDLRRNVMPAITGWPIWIPCLLSIDPETLIVLYNLSGVLNKAMYCF